MQSGQRRNQAKVSSVQSDIAELDTALVQNCKYVTWRLGHSNVRMFSGLVNKLMKERGQVKVNIFEESQMTVNIYVRSWQCRLNALSKAAAEVA